MSSTRNTDDFDLPHDYRDIYGGWRAREGSFDFVPGAYTTSAQPRRSNRQPEFVDLTSEGSGQPATRRDHYPIQNASNHGSASRGPRFANDIIDLDSQRTGFPEAAGRSAGRRSRIDNDGFEIVGQRQVSPVMPERYRAPPTRSSASASGFEQLSMVQRNAVGSIIQQFARNLPFALGSFLPPILDYRSVPFSNFGAPDIIVPDPEAVAAARYQSPPTAPSGFTYTPEESEAYVCPNCDEELRTGDSDIERQVWVIKTCGHAYCGQCAQNRSTTKHKKLKSPSKTKPFKQCVVDSCSARTTGVKSMTQIFI